MNAGRAILSIFLLAVYSGVLSLVLGSIATDTTISSHFLGLVVYTPLLVIAQFVLFATSASILNRWYFYPLASQFLILLFGEFLFSGHSMPWSGSSIDAWMTVAFGYFTAYIIVLIFSIVFPTAMDRYRRPVSWMGAVVLGLMLFTVGIFPCFILC